MKTDNMSLRFLYSSFGISVKSVYMDVEFPSSTQVNKNPTHANCFQQIFYLNKKKVYIHYPW